MQQAVRIAKTEFYAEVAGGAQNVSVADALSFDGVRDTVEALAGELARVWEQVKPAEASVEFGLALTAKPGRLTALLVEGDAQASLKVTVKWKSGKDDDEA